MNKKVAILLSTYNGEKYIKEQLDSILVQTYPNIEIIVRDDGSRDQTISILKEYEKNKKIKLYLGENAGFIRSFFELLKMDNDAMYYAFADQDDIWKPEKIEKAVEQLENQELEIPLLYCTNYEICNEDGKVVAQHKKIKNISFANALVECIAPGMTMVINKKAKDLMISKGVQDCYYHDWWTYLVCVSNGKVIYDDFKSVFYRRHINAATNREKNIIKVQLWRIKEIIQNGYLKKTKKQIQSFYEKYQEDLSLENRKIILPFVSKYKIEKSIQKIMYPKRYRNTLFDEILLRILFLINLL